MHEKHAFTRRPDLAHKGKTLTFCNYCFETVATSYWEFELDRAEDNHACDQRQREYWEKIIAESKTRESKRKESAPGDVNGSSHGQEQRLKSADLCCAKIGNRSTFIYGSG